MHTLVGCRATVCTLPDFPLSHFCSACLYPHCANNNRFDLVAADAYSNVTFDDDDDPVSIVTIGDFYGAEIPDMWVPADSRAKKLAMCNDYVRSWLVGCVRGVPMEV